MLARRGRGSPRGAAAARRRPSSAPRGSPAPGPSTSNGLTVTAHSPSSSCEPAFSERMRTPSRAFTSGASFETRLRPSKTAFTSSASYCLYAATDCAKLSATSRSTGIQPSRWKRVVHRARLALDRSEVLRVLRNVLPRRIEQREQRDAAVPSPDAARERARTRGSRARCSSTDRCGRRARRGLGPALRDQPLLLEHARVVAAAPSNSAGSMLIGWLVTSVRRPSMHDRRRLACRPRRRGCPRSCAGSSAASGSCAGRRRRSQAGPRGSRHAAPPAAPTSSRCRATGCG